MNSLSNLTAAQLRKAANLKDKIALFQKELEKILGNVAPSPASSKKNKARKMSKAGRAAIVAGQKARWAKEKQKKRKQK